MTARLKSLREFNVWLNTAITMKKRMQSKGLRVARAMCPHCDGGMLHAQLAGPRDHIHIRCTTPNCLTVME